MIKFASWLICREVTFLIMLCIIKRLVWAGGMICKPEQLVDSDEKPRELSRTITGGAAESETWASQSGLGC